MTNSEIDRELAEALGIYYTEHEGDIFADMKGDIRAFSPTTNGEQCMKLIDEYKISISYIKLKDKTVWYATLGIDEPEETGATPQIAACLALISSLKEKNND